MPKDVGQELAWASLERETEVFTSWGKTLVPLNWQKKLGKLNSSPKFNLWAESPEDVRVDGCSHHKAQLWRHKWKMSVPKQSKPGPSAAAALKIAPPARIQYFLATSDCQTPAMHCRFLRGSLQLPQKQMPKAAFSRLKLSLPFLHSKCSTFLELFYLENITVNPSHEKLPRNTSADVRGNSEVL